MVELDKRHYSNVVLLLEQKGIKHIVTASQYQGKVSDRSINILKPKKIEFKVNNSDGCISESDYKEILKIVSELW